ncbi:MAG: NAD(P)H-dependent oxidoreductase, partial [Thermoguttaceae bacterium]
MKIFVLIGHQRQGSFCHAIASAAIEELKTAGHSVIFHDLYAEKFDPILPHEEIVSQSELDPIVRQHCAEIVAADAYIVVHPNWWAMPPAILKGWLDRVLRQGVAYEFTAQGVNGLLKGRKAVVFTTSNTPREDELRLFGDPLDNLWKAC